MYGEGAALAGAVWRAESAIRRALDAVLGAAGLGAGEFFLLLELRSVRGARLRPADLAARLGVTPSGVTRMVSRLERAGLLEREAHERDARATSIALSDRGRDRIDEVLPAAEAAVERLLERVLKDNERTALLGYLERLGFTP